MTYGKSGSHQWLVGDEISRVAPYRLQMECSQCLDVSPRFLVQQNFCFPGSGLKRAIARAIRVSIVTISTDNAVNQAWGSGHADGFR